MSSQDDKNQNAIHGKVSIIIPTYKRDVSFLSRAVESVQKQTYKNIEIIVVDDSPDSYEKRASISDYMDSVLGADDRVIYLKNEKNLGGSLARNRGINTATGEYITFLDDDDEYKPEKVEKQLKYMNSHKCDVSFSNMIMYNDAGMVVDMRTYHDIPAFDNDSLLKYHLLHHMTGTPTFMYRTAKLKEIGGFEDAKMGQEFFLMLKSIERGLKIAYIDDCDVIVYKHAGEAITNGKNKISGENNLYQFKQKYFYRLSAKEIRFVKFRHYAVMVVAYMRNSMYLRAAKAGITAFIVSPADFISQVGGFAIKIVKHKKSNK
ncbi:MAG: glycosyltransferase [Bacteroides sp.]|nr:glycosyltransferase [Bacteroides sp.]